MVKMLICLDLLPLKYHKDMFNTFLDGESAQECPVSVQLVGRGLFFLSNTRNLHPPSFYSILSSLSRVLLAFKRGIVYLPIYHR